MFYKKGCFHKKIDCFTRQKGFDKDTFPQPSILVYSFTIVVHLGSFLLAIVSKNVHFSHYCVSRVGSWAPVESARVHTRERGSGMLSLVLEFIKVSLFPGGCIPER